MDLVREERRDIEANSNTAQTQLSDALTRLDKRTTEVNVPDGASGELDFSVLSARGFSRVKCITLGPGRVTDVRGLPEGLTKLTVAHNKLIGLDDIPASLRELECAHNYITHLDLERTPELRVLKCAHNRLTELESLPATLEELDCDGNQISKLELSRTPALRSLFARDNHRSLVIQNRPAALARLELDSGAEIAHAGSVGGAGSGFGESKADTDTAGTDTKRDFADALDAYFRLKSRYEEGVRKQRRAAFAGAVARGFSARVARKRAAEMVPLCIACRKPGGTVFRHTDHKHIAICGHATPCRLNIKIFGSVFYDLEELVDEYSREMEITKQEIIRQKMDALFNYVSDARAAAAFEDALDKYHAKSELFRDISEAHARVHANPHRRALLLRKEEQLGDAVERVRALMARFRDSGDRELLRAAVHAQVNDVAPAALTLRQLRHAVMESTPDPEHTERTILFQRAAPLADKVFSYAEPPQVVAFRV